MSLDGMRAWIGEVERKLGMRTRVFLVLAVIAIGGAGAAIYLALDARDNAVSESDVQALQDRLEAQIGTGGAAGSAVADQAQLEAELKALRAEVEQLSGNGTPSAQKGGASGGGNGGGSNGGDTGGESSGAGGATSPSPGGSSPGTAGGASGEGTGGASLPELLEQAKKQNEEDKADEAGR